MFYVYIIVSLAYKDRIYVGYTTNVNQRLETHNAGGSVYTSNYRPWKIVSYTAFDNIQSAKLFEKYLKMASGKAFLAKHLLSRD